MQDQLLSLIALPVPAWLFAGLLGAVLMLSQRLSGLAERLERRGRLMEDMDRAADRMEARLARLEARHGGQQADAQVIAFRR